MLNVQTSPEVQNKDISVPPTKDLYVLQKFFKRVESDLLTGWTWYYDRNLNCVRNWHWNRDIMHIMMARFWFWLRHWLWDWLRLRLRYRHRARCRLWFRFWMWVVVVVSIATSRPFSSSMSTTRCLVIVDIPTVLTAACPSYVNVTQIRGTKAPQNLKIIQ